MIFFLGVFVDGVVVGVFFFVGVEDFQLNLSVVFPKRVQHRAGIFEPIAGQPDLLQVGE